MFRPSEIPEYKEVYQQSPTRQDFSHTINLLQREEYIQPNLRYAHEIITFDNLPTVDIPESLERIELPGNIALVSLDGHQLQEHSGRILKSLANTYKIVFNTPPWSQEFTLDSAESYLKQYLDTNTKITLLLAGEKILGGIFLSPIVTSEGLKDNITESLRHNFGDFSTNDISQLLDRILKKQACPDTKDIFIEELFILQDPLYTYIGSENNIKAIKEGIEFPFNLPWTKHTENKNLLNILLSANEDLPQDRTELSHELYRILMLALNIAGFTSIKHDYPDNKINAYSWSISGSTVASLYNLLCTKLPNYLMLLNRLKIVPEHFPLIGGDFPIIDYKNRTSKIWEGNINSSLPGSKSHELIVTKIPVEELLLILSDRNFNKTLAKKQYQKALRMMRNKF